MAKAEPYGPIDKLAERADTLAGAWAARARTSTTVGRERALLRLFGVGGLDAAGRPLAWAAVDRYLGGGPRPARRRRRPAVRDGARRVRHLAPAARPRRRVGRGRPRHGGGAAPRGRPAGHGGGGGASARRCGRSSGSTRTGPPAGSCSDVLGDPTRPWIGTTIPEPEIEDAIVAARRALDAGADVVQVEIPIGRELTERLRDAGLDAPVWQPRGSDLRSETADHAPTGSQRALTALRHQLDEIAAQRRNYVRLAAVPPALGAPGVGGRRGVRARRYRRVRPDGRDRRRPGRAGPRPGRPRLRPRPARARRRRRRRCRPGRSSSVRTSPGACPRTPRPGPGERSRSRRCRLPSPAATACPTISSWSARCRTGWSTSPCRRPAPPPRSPSAGRSTRTSRSRSRSRRHRTVAQRRVGRDRGRRRAGGRLGRRPAARRRRCGADDRRVAARGERDARTSPAPSSRRPSTARPWSTRRRPWPRRSRRWSGSPTTAGGRSSATRCTARSKVRLGEDSVAERTEAFDPFGRALATVG